MQASQKQKLIGSIISLTIGAITGFIAIFFGFALPAGLTGEGLIGIALIETDGYATLFLYLSFLITIWFAGKIVANEIIKGTGLFKVSWKYSIIVNFVIWPVFIVTSFIYNKFFSYGADSFFTLILPLVLFTLSLLLTPFTVGLLICFIIKKRLLENRSDSLIPIQ